MFILAGNPMLLEIKSIILRTTDYRERKGGFDISAERLIGAKVRGTTMERAKIIGSLADGRPIREKRRSLQFLSRRRVIRDFGHDYGPMELINALKQQACGSGAVPNDESGFDNNVDLEADVRY